MTSTSNPDRELLRRELDLLWGRDSHGRTSRPPAIAVGVARDGHEVLLSGDLEPELIARWTAAIDADPGDHDRPPGAFADLAAELHDQLPTELISCFSYVLEPATMRDSPVPPAIADSVTIWLPTGHPEPALEAARPDPEWAETEWHDLLAGRLGPWAIAVAEHRTVALCHAARESGGVAEAGVWTHPEFRGRGLAGLATAAWAKLARPGRDALFYSHFDDNAASAAVARKLGARPIGRIWQLRGRTR